MEATQIILIVFIVLLIVLYPILIYSRNKKENLRMQEQTNSLKNGDKVLTTNGIYGTIVNIQDEHERKVVILETGDETNKGYVAVDAFAIYRIFPDESLSPQEDANSSEQSGQEEQGANIEEEHENKNDEEQTDESLSQNQEDNEEDSSNNSSDEDDDGTKGEE